jgi:hypothetical protein
MRHRNTDKCGESRVSRNMKILGRSDGSTHLHPKFKDVTILFVLFVCFHLFRAPRALIEGRFWAEEGSLWWDHARRSGVWSQLTYVVPGNGYISLNANIQTFFASLLPIRIAPLLTTWTSLLGMFLPAAILILLPRRLFKERSITIFVASLLLFSSPGLEPDVFANSINLQTHLAIALSVCIFADWDLISTRLFCSLVIPLQLLAILSGSYGLAVGAIVLIIALIGIWRRREIESLGQSSKVAISFVILSILAIVVQISVFLVGLSEHGVRAERARHPLPNIHNFLSFFASNLSTVGWSRTQSDQVFERLLLDSSSAAVVAIPFLILVILCVFPLMSRRLTDRGTKTWKDEFLSSARWVPLNLLFAYVTISLVTLYGYASPIPNTRYQVVASAILVMCVLSAIAVNFDGSSLRAMKYVIGGYLLIVGFVGMQNDPWTYLTCGRSCVPWSTQVAEAEDGLRQEFIFWPMHSDPQFTSAVRLDG